mmetsp:Transcript_61800/g.201649  ORF Transcript_61800/g.201649 Transcript_61800/m.201649 type:complete len:203 (-) Transcript_61800:318-926(-)|eukprot:CAMPEP_0203915694 /NCGR_PEP_ID=MMETSP0359-20131031/56468_1 /ASSEMBLY_ACC=CAM_ASM_000338 /TAXON_ID=268821 /ORGANISM="Scrippsiella Hangoei, Strain SHTV-5" /LENGTH=202 /DNA_ID=CAMNT_0050842249 /DNA_START=48 /DNA_END=656 /DNA_ORIENTATION=+
MGAQCCNSASEESSGPTLVVKSLPGGASAAAPRDAHGDGGECGGADAATASGGHQSERQGIACGLPAPPEAAPSLHESRFSRQGVEDLEAVLQSEVAKAPYQKDEDEVRRAKAVPRETGLPLTFRTDDGHVVEVVFTRRPLGLDLRKKQPIMMMHVKGLAVELGVREGWILVKVGGEDIQDLNFSEVYVMMVAKSADLPRAS